MSLSKKLKAEVTLLTLFKCTNINSVIECRIYMKIVVSFKIYSSHNSTMVSIRNPMLHIFSIIVIINDTNMFFAVICSAVITLFPKIPTSFVTAFIIYLHIYPYSWHW